MPVITHSNWKKHAALGSDATTVHTLFAHSIGFDVKYAYTATHVFVYTDNTHQLYLIAAAELSDVPNMQPWVVRAVSMLFEGLSNEVFRMMKQIKLPNRASTPVPHVDDDYHREVLPDVDDRPFYNQYFDGDDNV